MAGTILQQEEGQIVFLSDPGNLSVPTPTPTPAGDQPAEERALFFSQIAGFRVEHARLALNPVAATGGSASSGEASS